VRWSEDSSAAAHWSRRPDSRPVQDLHAALGAIEKNYVGEVESDRLVYSAISGNAADARSTLELLRPEGVRADARAAEGPYYGLGISIAVIDGDITVANVFEASPAYQKGVRRGDIIAKIEG
jgi:carboxyl-terminal processing protease